ncbi:MAG: curli assembly protein CsgF, partial [Bacteroidota bacterium]
MRSLCLFAAACVALAFSSSASAQQFIYTPKNPAFGGSPLNYSWMLSSAQAQNDLGEDGSSAFTRDPLA